MNRIKTVMLMMVSGIMLLACLNGCKQDHLTYNTSGVLNMYDYMSANPDQYSMFKAIVDKAGYASFLNTYGTYTLFLPTNDGVTKYLKANNKTSVDGIDAATAKGLVSISIIVDTLNSRYFSDGKLRSPTTAGQYLVTGAVSTGSTTNITINKQANLLTANIKVGNGLIHVIDNMLVPATLTLAQTIEQNSKYSIFTSILKATGFYDTLNVAASAFTGANINRKYLTVIGETDSMFNADGFADYNAIKARYSTKTKNDPKNHADSLWLFAAYRIWPELSYISDIAITTSHITLAPLEITTSQVLNQNVLLNNDTFNGIQEVGQQLSRPNSDISANNGVLHSAINQILVVNGVRTVGVGTYTIKVRFPSPVYFDVAVQPEILRTPGLYRGSGTSLTFLSGTLANVAIIFSSTAGNYTQYTSLAKPVAAGNYYFNDDYITNGQRFRPGSNGQRSVEFITPVIVRGQYKIWVDYKRQSSQTQVIPAYFDNVALPNTFNDGDQLNAAETDAQAETRGFKSYSDAPVNTTASPYYDFVGRLLGIVNIATTDRHKIRFEATLDPNGAGVFILDVIEFRPVTMDQVHPRLGHAGNLVP